METAYRQTQSFPATERYGLQSQLRRAAVSVVANIAEGSARGTDRQLVHFLRIARASAAEVECLALVALRLEYASPESVLDLETRAREVSRLLLALQRRLSRPRSHLPAT